MSEDLKAELERLKAENAALKGSKPARGTSHFYKSLCCIDLCMVCKYPIIINLQSPPFVSRIPTLSYMIYA